MQSLITIHSENKYVIWILTHYLNILSTFLFFVFVCYELHEHLFKFLFFKIIKNTTKKHKPSYQTNVH